MKKILGCIVLSIALIFFIPIAVNWLFTKPALCELMVANWNEADALGYGGDVLSYLGTVVLGAVAVFQTSKAHGQTDRANQLAQDALVQTEKANELAAQMQRLEQARFVSMVSLIDVVYEAVASGGSKRVRNRAKPPISEHIVLSSPGTTPSGYFILDLDIENKSDYPIVQMMVHPGTRETDNCVVYGMVTSIERAVYIPAQGIAGISISIPYDILKKVHVSEMVLSIDFVNIFDYTTNASLYLYNLGVENRRFDYKYRLAKFVDVKPPEIAE